MARRPPRNRRDGLPPAAPEEPGAAWSPEDIEEAEERAEAAEVAQQSQARAVATQRRRSGLAVVAGKEGPGAKPAAPMDALRADLPLQGLTGKQEKFAILFVAGYSKSEAYREAYNVGVDTKLETVYRNAVSIANNAKVMARIEQLRLGQERQTSYSPAQLRGHIVDEMIGILFDKATSATGRLKAAELLGKVPGVDLFKTEDEDPRDRLDPEKVRNELARTLQSLLDKAPPKTDS